jgi:hypothetical protein
MSPVQGFSMPDASLAYILKSKESYAPYTVSETSNQRARNARSTFKTLHGATRNLVGVFPGACPTLSWGFTWAPVQVCTFSTVS